MASNVTPGLRRYHEEEAAYLLWYAAIPQRVMLGCAELKSIQEKGGGGMFTITICIHLTPQTRRWLRQADNLPGLGRALSDRRVYGLWPWSVVLCNHCRTDVWPWQRYGKQAQGHGPYAHRQCLKRLVKKTCERGEE